jgi:2-polyprenyl-6-methoxyphenol hydroxylase-like FAD-dependent oxidoreductase
MEKWYREGLLCIGDSAHAMSPIAGVGINLAVQDAVAAANVLAPRLIEGNLTVEDLKSIQDRRMLPTIATQTFQRLIQNMLIKKVIKTKDIQVPLIFKIIKQFTYLRRFPAYLVGVGVRPEHVSSYILNKGKNN